MSEDSLPNKLANLCWRLYKSTPEGQTQRGDHHPKIIPERHAKSAHPLILASKFRPPQRRSPIQRMALRRRVLILPPDLNCLICLTHNQPQPCPIKRAAHDARLGVQTARLRRRVQRLEPVARLPVPEADAPVVAAGEEYVVLVHGQAVDDGVLAVEVLHEGPFRAFPLLDGAGGAGGEGEFGGVQGESADAFFVVCEDARGLAGREVPESDGAIEGGGDDLRVCGLAF